MTKHASTPIGYSEVVFRGWNACILDDHFHRLAGFGPNEIGVGSS